MNKATYTAIQSHMHTKMEDSAHDSQHVYRVLYAALEIAAHETAVNMDVLIAACLLHDIGRKAQFDDPTLCHAKVGSGMAYAYLVSLGWSAGMASHVRDCISSHRYRGNNIPASIEAKILFDADKLEAAGAVGIARTLIYQGQESEPLYAVDASGHVLYGTADNNPSFFHEYNHKLKRIYDKFYTARGRQLAQQRQATAQAFYDGLTAEVNAVVTIGQALLGQQLGD